MQLNEQQQKFIGDFTGSSSGRILVSILEDLVRHYSDVRTITKTTSEELIARQKVCEILQTELLDRFRLLKPNNKEIEEEYE